MIRIKSPDGWNCVRIPIRKNPLAPIVSHPTPLHPDADLAVVLDDLRQNVAAWGDEGMVMRVFRASICLMLLSILDTLIDLLADFRAGRLPPVLPAYDETPNERMAPPASVPADPAAISKQRAASRHMSAPRAAAPHGTSADLSEQWDAQHAAPAPRRPAFTVSPSRHLNQHAGHGPRGLVFYPSHVPRRPFEKIWKQGSADLPCLIRYEFVSF
jgi:hypothetical protein